MAKVGGKRPGAGRPKGAKNKRTLAVEQRLAALGCDPIEGMARIAMETAPCLVCDATGRVGDDEPCGQCKGVGRLQASLELRGKMYSDLAQYVAPKRKAVEVSGAEGRPVRFQLVLTHGADADG